MRLGYFFSEKEFFMRRNGLPLRAHGLLTQNGHAEETQNFFSQLRDMELRCARACAACRS